MESQHGLCSPCYASNSFNRPRQRFLQFHTHCSSCSKVSQKIFTSKLHFYFYLVLCHFLEKNFLVFQFVVNHSTTQPQLIKQHTYYQMICKLHSQYQLLLRTFTELLLSRCLPPLLRHYLANALLSNPLAVAFPSFSFHLAIAQMSLCCCLAIAWLSLCCCLAVAQLSLRCCLAVAFCHQFFGKKAFSLFK